MNTMNKFWFNAFAIIGAMFMLFSSCKKDDVDDKNIPVLSTTKVTKITQTTAMTGGNITDDGGASITTRGVCWSTSQNPTINDSKTEDGKGAGSFTSSITGSEPNTTYYVRAYATNSEGTGYSNIISFTTLERVTDADGNVYTTVVIGNQEWFAENLKTTKYNDGTPIPNVTNNTDWGNLRSGAYAWYNNNEANYKNTYGALYNWHAVNTGDLCPMGWHVPTDAEWTALTDYVGGESVAATKLKATSGWFSGSNGTDEYGFSALPGGYRINFDSGFYDLRYFGAWWTSTGTTNSWTRYIYYDYRNVSRNSYAKEYGLSVRCVKNN